MRFAIFSLQVLSAFSSSHFYQVLPKHQSPAACHSTRNSCTSRGAAPVSRNARTHPCFAVSAHDATAPDCASLSYVSSGLPWFVSYQKQNSLANGKKSDPLKRSRPKERHARTKIMKVSMQYHRLHCFHFFAKYRLIRDGI